MSQGTLKKAKDSRLAARVRKAIGASPDEVVEVTTPQFTREPGAPDPAAPPVDFEALRSMDATALRELGCRAWDVPDVDGNVLMLFPGEWYSSVPIGLVVVSIFGTKKAFRREPSTRDIRCGCLPFGFCVPERR